MSPCSASVIALSESTVLKIEEADYNILAAKNPNFAHTLTQFVINRLRCNDSTKYAMIQHQNIAVVVAARAVISLQGQMKLLNLSYMDIAINASDAVPSWSNTTKVFFDELDDHTGINFLVCDSQHEIWANQCITYCDLILVVSDFYASEDVKPIETQLNLYTSNILNKKVYLILLHPENAPMPTNTRRWFKERQLNLHLHLRKNNLKDIRRFSRIITNRAVGLVLGGGGAKGFSHIGTAKAMIESGVEFDFIGGTSAGALFGVLLSFVDFNIEEAIRVGKQGAEKKPTSSDYNFPFLSLMTGKKMRSIFVESFGENHIEDLWISSFVISTNYSTATLKVHEMGLTRKQIEASIAIPGVFPPVIIDNQIFVDGGVMDNLPIGIMSQKPVRHIVAIALSVQSPHIVEIDNVPTAWEIFVNKITKKRRFRLPSMSTILINSLTLNSLQKQATNKTQVSLYIEMDLRSFGFLDWSKWQQLIDKGYEQTRDHINALPSDEHFWKQTSQKLEKA
ncbi:MAG: patatin-like phospholipase family protein [Saprospiraceae bacterium]